MLCNQCLPPPGPKKLTFLQGKASSGKTYQYLAKEGDITVVDQCINHKSQSNLNQYCS
jgi:hypothetical protein